MDSNNVSRFELDFVKLNLDNQVYILGMIRALLFAQELERKTK